MPSIPSLKRATQLLAAAVVLALTTSASSDAESPLPQGLAALGTSSPDALRTVVVCLEGEASPDPAALADAYALTSRTTWHSDTMSDYRAALAPWTHAAPGWSLQRTTEGFWEEPLPYIAFAHALILCCRAADLEKLVRLPFVNAVLDGETPVAVSRWEPPASGEPLPEPATLAGWSDGPVPLAELLDRSIAQGWLLIAAEAIHALCLDPQAATLAAEPPTTPADGVALTAVAALTVPIHDIGEETAWPYGLTANDLGESPTSVERALLLQLVDEALAVGASAITVTHDASPGEGGDLALFWGTAATGGALPLVEMSATQGAHPDLVVVNLAEAELTGTFELLRAAPGDPLHRSIGVGTEGRFVDTDVELCARYTYRVRGLAGTAAERASVGAVGYIGRVPETTEWLHASDGSPTTPGIVIEWSPVVGAVDYVLYRSEPVNAPSQRNSKVYRVYLGPDTMFVDLDVVPGVVYQYTALPGNGCGRSAVANASDRGFAMYVEPPEGRPQPPASVAATLVDPDDRIELAWWAVPGATEYRVLRATAYQGPYELAHATAATTWSDDSAVYCQDYWYRIQTVEDGEAGPLSAVAHGVCGSKPSKAQDITVSQNAYCDRIRIEWTSGERAEWTTILRSTSADGPYTQVGRTEDTVFFDLDLPPEVTFWYRLEARNACGGSGTAEPVLGSTSAS